MSFLSGVAEQFAIAEAKLRAWSSVDGEDSTDESYDEDFAGGTDSGEGDIPCQCCQQRWNLLTGLVVQSSAFVLERETQNVLSLEKGRGEGQTVQTVLDIPRAGLTTLVSGQSAVGNGRGSFSIGAEPSLQLGFEILQVKVAQLCLTLCDPRDYTVHGILQPRILEWVAFPFSRGSSHSRD